MLILFTSIAAFATTYTDTGTWPIKTAAFPGAGGLDVFQSEVSVYFCQGSPCPSSGSSGTFASDWSKVYCKADYDATSGTNYYSMVLDVDESTWPTAGEWAAHPTVTCQKTVGADTYKKIMTIATNPDPIPATTPVLSLTTGWAVTLHTAGDRTAVAGQWARQLPAGAYTEGLVQAKLTGGATWTGVRCFVDEATTGAATGSTDYLILDFTSGAVEGTGYCPIVKSGTTYNMPVSIDRP